MTIGGFAFTIDWPAVTLVAVIAAVALIVWQAQKDAHNDLNIYDLVMEDGKLSKVACVMMGAFLCTTWIVIWLALQDKLSEGYLTIYVGAWVAPTITRIIAGKSSAKGE